MTDSAEHYVRQVPRDESGRLELLATRPPLWEYLLFGNVLYVSRSAYEARWRDYQLGYSLKVGPLIEPTQILDMISERMSRAAAITSNLELILAPAAQERAFGNPGEPGDAALIEHMAVRLIDLYALLLEWAEETRALRVPDWAERLKGLAVSFVRQPLQRAHDFVDEFIAEIEQAIADLADGSSQVTITMKLTFTIDDALVREFQKERRRIRRRYNLR
jgi:hypothetical protein